MEIVKGIFTAAKSIYQLCDQAESNKKQCKYLKDRIRLLMIPVKVIREKPDKPKEMEQILSELSVILGNAENWLKKYNKKAWWMRFIRSGHIKEEFNHINRRISDIAEPLKMVLILGNQDSFMEHFERNHMISQNQKAIHEDIEETIQSLQSNMRSLADTMDSLSSQIEDQKSIHITQLLQEIRLGWSIDFIRSTDLKRGELVINTCYHSVYKGEYHKDTVAIKELKGDLNRDTNYVRKEFESERETMKKFECVNILRLFGICIDNSNSEPCYSLVMEFCEKGVLQDLLNAERGLTWAQRVPMARDAARALYRLHHSEIKVMLHGSLSSSKFLVDGTYCLKLYEFQFSKTESSMRRNPSVERRKESLGWAYMAPEILQNINAYTKQSEVYSLGVVLYEIASGNVPLEGLIDPENHLNELHQMLRAEVDAGLPTDCPEILRDIITQSLERDPRKRPTAGAIADRLIAYLNQD